MDLIEKVFLLRKVDLLQDVESDYLTLLGSVSVESTLDAGDVVVRRGEPAGGLHLVTRGRVRLEQDDGSTEELGEGQHFGAWDLVDPAPASATVRAAGPVRLLRIERADFQDVLSDHPGLALDLLESLARRARTLVA